MDRAPAGCGGKMHRFQKSEKESKKNWILVELFRKFIRFAMSLFMIAASLLPLSSIAQAATTYFISPTGNDSANGKSDATAFKTLQKGASVLIAGDTLMVRPGTYAGFVMGWDFAQNGTATAPITIKADPGAVINSRNNKTPDGINLEGASFIVIDGFTMNNPSSTMTRAGIRSVGNQGVVIRNNKVDGMGTWGIFTSFSENILIENNIASNSVKQHGIYHSNSGDHPIIRGNQSFGNAQCGIHMNGDLSQGGDGLISFGLVENNIVHDNGAGGGAGINMDGVQDSIVQNNLLYNNHASGITMFQADGAQGPGRNKILNNTIHMASNSRWSLRLTNEVDTIEVKNNNLKAKSLKFFVAQYQTPYAVKVSAHPPFQDGVVHNHPHYRAGRMIA